MPSSRNSVFVAFLASSASAFAAGTGGVEERASATEINLADVLLPALAQSENRAAQACARQLSEPFLMVPPGTKILKTKQLDIEGPAREAAGRKMVCALALADVAGKIDNLVKDRPATSYADLESAMRKELASFDGLTRAAASKVDLSRVSVLVDPKNGTPFQVFTPVAYDMDDPRKINNEAADPAETFRSPVAAVIQSGVVTDWQANDGGAFHFVAKMGEPALLLRSGRPWVGGAGGLLAGQAIKITVTTKATSSFR